MNWPCFGIEIFQGKVAKPGINKTSEGFGFEAYKYIIEGKKDKGNELLTRALALDYFDVRHYFNRSYSQLCTGDYQGWVYIDMNN